MKTNYGFVPFAQTKASPETISSDIWKKVWSANIRNNLKLLYNRG